MNTETPGQGVPILCPSAPPTDGAILLGAINPEGIVAYLPAQQKINALFIAGAAHNQQQLTDRFRFSNECVPECRHWNGEQCIAPDVVRQYVRITMPEELRARTDRCSIRPQCRWFRQEGYTACELCPIIRSKPLLSKEGEKDYTYEYRRVE